MAKETYCSLYERVKTYVESSPRRLLVEHKNGKITLKVRYKAGKRQLKFMATYPSKNTFMRMMLKNCNKQEFSLYVKHNPTDIKSLTLFKDKRNISISEASLRLALKGY